MCSIDGAWLAPIPPTTLAIGAPAFLHLLADLGQRCVRHARELDHHVDRHPGPPEPDPVALPYELLLPVRQAELRHPGFFVLRAEVALVLVLERIRSLVQPDAAGGRRLVEEVEVPRQLPRLHGVEPCEVVLSQ